MPSTKPRMMLTLEPQTLATLNHYARLLGKPTSTVVSHLLTAGRPEIEKLGVLMQQARELEARSSGEQARFLARIEVMANRASAAQEFIQSDLVTSVSLPSAPLARGAKAPATVGKKGAKKAPLSLIHTNKSHNSTPARLPAASVKKKGRK